MIDTAEVIRGFLTIQPQVTGLTGQRIWAERDTPPEGYVLSNDGPAICFKRRGGGVDYESVVLRPSVQFKLYGRTELEANQVYRALFDVLSRANTGLILAAELETQGQTLYEPETGWPYVLVFFKFQIIN